MLMGIAIQLLIFLLFSTLPPLQAMHYSDSDLSLEEEDINEIFNLPLKHMIEQGQNFPIPDLDDHSLLSFGQQYFVDKFSIILIENSLEYLENKIKILASHNHGSYNTFINIHDIKHCPFSRFQSQVDCLEMVHAELISNLEMRLSSMEENELIFEWREGPPRNVSILCTYYRRDYRDAYANCWDYGWHAFNGATCGTSWFINAYFYAGVNPFLIASAIPGSLCAVGRVMSGIYDHISDILIRSWLADESLNIREQIRKNAVEQMQSQYYTEKLNKLLGLLPHGSISLLFPP